MQFSSNPFRLQSPEDMDKILGLDYGADDYMTKPFNILEVKARIKAILRRSSKPAQREDESMLIAKDMKLDREGRRVYIEEREINLTAKEFDVLELLVFHPNKVYDRDALLDLVWGKDYPGDARTVDVHITKLRKKLNLEQYIKTVYKTGYRLEI